MVISRSNRTRFTFWKEHNKADICQVNTLLPFSQTNTREVYGYMRIQLTKLKF